MQSGNSPVVWAAGGSAGPAPWSRLSLDGGHDTTDDEDGSHGTAHRGQPLAPLPAGHLGLGDDLVDSNGVAFART